MKPNGTMRARIRLYEGVAFVGESGSGHASLMDGAPDAGGRNLGMRPMEMMLLGLGGCTAFDVVTILRKGRKPVADCVVELEAERARDPPRVFTRVHLRYTVSGHGLRAADVERAVQLSTEKYCSATLMLRRGGVAISHELRVVDEL